MIETLLQITHTTLPTKKMDAISELFGNLWFWIALIEFALLLIFIYLTFKKKKNAMFDETILNESKKSDVDIENVINSMYQSKALYNTLKVRCHPDRFTDPDLNKIADNLFQEITKNKTNYKKLQELKIRAIEQLKITI